jgi:predicted metal-binding membrane protein
MAQSTLSTVLERDRLISLLALAVLVLLAWLYLFWTQSQMAAAAMPDMATMPGMESMMGPMPTSWTPVQALLVFVMWAIMMVAMMLPSAAPMILTYVQVARHARTTPFASGIWFVGGYLLAWFSFSLVATLAQYGLQQAMLLTPMLALQSRPIAGALLIAAGVYQWTPLKNLCLSNCRAPLAFVQQHGGFRPEALGSVRLGLLHGLYCVGCCWLVMVLLFVGGVMNIAWIAVLALIVLAEKILPGARYISVIAGIVSIVAGLWLIVV